MDLHAFDIAVLVLYLTGMIALGFLVERRARRGIDDYFLGGHAMPWWMLSISNAASMFDLSGTMWLVSLLYLYGVKSVFLPWQWPVFNQIFLMIYMSAWLRRSGVMTGAEWIALRFGKDRGAKISRLSVVAFAVISVIGFTAYAFVGLVKFAEVFVPQTVSPVAFATGIVAVTTLYTVVGGLISVVATDLVQYVIMVACSLALGAIAMAEVSPEMIAAAVPAGWDDLLFGWRLELDWSQKWPAATTQIEQDGLTMFGAFFSMMVFKGLLVSVAGPAPNFDMQRILAARNAREASLMSGLVTVVLFAPRYFMVAGVAVMALTLYGAEVRQAGSVDLEQILPMVIRDFVPRGLKGLLMAGLLAAFMSTFAGTINAAAAYLVNDVYKHHLRPSASQRELVTASYATSLAVVVTGCLAGYDTPSVDTATKWITAALWGGYAAPNVLKWHWWRMNGYGYFAGMMSGIAAAVVLLIALEGADLMMSFPILLAAAALGSAAGSLLSAPQPMDQLHAFYVRTRPWGWWGPVAREAQRRDSRFDPNRNWPRDLTNVAVGIVWQTAFVVAPIYVVIRDWRSAATALVVILATSAILKLNWYDHLPTQGTTSAPSHDRRDKRI